MQVTHHAQAPKYWNLSYVLTFLHLTVPVYVPEAFLLCVNSYNLNVIFTALYTNLYDPYLVLLKLNHGVECLPKPQQEVLIIL
jgi:hypothetical protein